MAKLIVEKRDIKIYRLVDMIDNGELLLPEMQRRYVWKQTQVRDLLDSLYRGYPSGTILSWKSNDPVVTRNFAVNQKANATDFQLLLDGQQRLTSLKALINEEPIIVRDRKLPIDILFNLEHSDQPGKSTKIEDDDVNGGDEDPEESANSTLDFEHMTFVVANKKLAKQNHWVSVTKVFQEADNTPFLEMAFEPTGIIDYKDPLYKKYNSRLNALRQILEYEYRVHILGGKTSYEEVTDIFVRVNSLGTKLRSSDLALAQITCRWDDSLKHFRKIRRRM